MFTHGIPNQVTLGKESGREVVAQFRVHLDLEGNGHLGYFADERPSLTLTVPVDDWDVQSAIGGLRSKMRSSDEWAIVPDWPVG